MSAVHVFLFGKFRVELDGRTLADMDRQKVRELFCYLVLYRDRPHPRETLATLLWGENPTAISRKYLRQTLWQLRSALGGDGALPQMDLLLVEPEWIQLNPDAEIWLDAAQVEQAFSLARGVVGHDLDARSLGVIQHAIELVRGDLLEGCYHEWVLYERERFRHIHLALLDKMVNYHEAHGDFEAGITYATEVLRHEPARERTHRQLMRLYYLSRDRTAALHQYNRCVAALSENLAVPPAKRTMALYEQIQRDRLDNSGLLASRNTPETRLEIATVRQALSQLQQLNALLRDVEDRVRHELHAIEHELNLQ